MVVPRARSLVNRSGIDAEVIDLRTLRPLDSATVVDSVTKTNRVVVVEEGPLTGGWAGEVHAVVVEQSLGDLDDAWRIATRNGPIPYSPRLEDELLPSPDAIVARSHQMSRGDLDRDGALPPRTWAKVPRPEAKSDGRGRRRISGWVGGHVRALGRTLAGSRLDADERTMLSRILGTHQRMR